MLSDARWTFILIAACTIIFLLEPILPMKELMFTPAYALQKPWMFITSIFLHANFSHLFFNMLALFFFGVYLEPKIGEKKFLLAYFISGIVGNLGFWLFMPHSTIPGLGASGAIYGILGVLAVLEPKLIIYVDFIPMPMIVAAGLWLVISLIGSFEPLNGIGYQAHLFGLVFGIAYGGYLRYMNRRRQQDRHYYSYSFGW